jgi:glycosyltransferase involved in cell wall biosynthesis
MRIAQVAPLHERVPPVLYGGTERVVSYLTEELVAQGQEVTLFASGDSLTHAKLVAGSERSLRLDERVTDPLPHHIVLLEEVLTRAREFDVIHFHIDYVHFPFCQRESTPHITTLHGRLDLPDLKPLLEKFRDLPLISISDAQREPLPWANWLATVHHGLPLDLYTPNVKPGTYLLFLGRMSAEKGFDRAVAIAERAGMPLKFAAKVEDDHRQYYEAVIRSAHRGLVEDVGEVGDGKKQQLLANAHALLFPIDWPEPFGLVLIESMACGTPVIAFRRGSVPELVDDGITGFVVDDVVAAATAVSKVRDLDRLLCRKRFEERFSATRMARQYLAIYEHLIGD